MRNQVWSHATNTLEQVQKAVRKDSDVTAIECDILMGSHSTCSSSAYQKEPVLTHPPSTSSDVTFAQFLDCVTLPSSEKRCDLVKHIKLDFKELEALKPSLDLILQKNINNPRQKVLTLNADILPGPGNRSACPISASDFLRACIDFTAKKVSDLNIALSLGYKCDWSGQTGYTQQDVAAMAALIHQFELATVGVDIILALNARVLAKRVNAFDSFLKSLPRTQILAWTGTGEPPIPKQTIAHIEDHFRSVGLLDRYGLDCVIQW